MVSEYDNKLGLSKQTDLGYSIHLCIFDIRFHVVIK